MNKATITKTIKSVDSWKGPESLGFVRYFVLPSRIKSALHLRHLLETGCTNAHDRIVTFFAGMSETEYAEWMEDK